MESCAQHRQPATTIHLVRPSTRIWLQDLRTLLLTHDNIFYVTNGNIKLGVCNTWPAMREHKTQNHDIGCMVIFPWKRYHISISITQLFQQDVSSVNWMLRIAYMKEEKFLLNLLCFCNKEHGFLNTIHMFNIRIQDIFFDSWFSKFQILARSSKRLRTDKRC